MKKRIINLCIVILLIFTAACFLLPQSAFAKKYTYTVKKGDTLWDICNKFYGNSNLWPKLWEMNSFITNPHLLKPGDVITLFQKPEKSAPVKPKIAKKEVKKGPPPAMGINLDGIINPGMVGFFSFNKINSWGTIFASKEKRSYLAQGDTVFILFKKGKKVAVGDRFIIGRPSPRLRLPLDKKKSGYIFNPKGTLVIEKHGELGYEDGKVYQKENMYQAKIDQAYEAVNVNDIVIPCHDRPVCILPVPNSKNILANIIAAKNDRSLIYQNTIVYMDHGSNDGVKVGNIFEILKGNYVNDPNPRKELSLHKPLVILPDSRLGKIMVIETRPHTAAAIVLSTTEPVSKGAYLQNISWTKTPDFILSKADCPIN